MIKALGLTGREGRRFTRLGLSNCSNVYAGGTRLKPTGRVVHDAHTPEHRTRSPSRRHKSHYQRHSFTKSRSTTERAQESLAGVLLVSNVQMS